MVTNPGAKFTTPPTNVLTFADFMFRQGLIKTRSASWTDMFFPELYGLRAADLIAARISDRESAGAVAPPISRLASLSFLNLPL